MCVFMHACSCKRLLTPTQPPHARRSKSLPQLTPLPRAAPHRLYARRRCGAPRVQIAGKLPWLQLQEALLSQLQQLHALAVAAHDGGIACLCCSCGAAALRGAAAQPAPCGALDQLDG